MPPFINTTEPSKQYIIEQQGDFTSFDWLGYIIALVFRLHDISQTISGDEDFPRENEALRLRLTSIESSSDDAKYSKPAEEDSEDVFFEAVTEEFSS